MFGVDGSGMGSGDSLKKDERGSIYQQMNLSGDQLRSVARQPMPFHHNQRKGSGSTASDPYMWGMGRLE
jgi:hypothetical protein